MRREHVNRHKPSEAEDDEEAKLAALSAAEEKQTAEETMEKEYPALLKAANENVVMLGEQPIEDWPSLLTANDSGTPLHELPPIWERGVSLGLLCWWAMKVADTDSSTASAASKLRADTAGLKGSSFGLINVLRVSSGSMEAMGPPNATGTPIVFVSHVHSSKLFGTLEALCEWCLKKGSRIADCYVWFDIFACDLRKSGDKDARKVGDVVQVVSYIGHTVLVGVLEQPHLREHDSSARGQTNVGADHHRPHPALTRLWILYEALATIVAGAKLQYILLPQVEKQLRKRILTDFKSQFEEACAVSCADAKTLVSADAVIIRSWIKREMGTRKANALMLKSVRRWLLTDVEEWIETCLPSSAGVLEAMQLRVAHSSLLLDLERFGEAITDADHVIETSVAENAQSERQATAMRQAQHRAKLVQVRVLKKQHKHMEAISLCRMLLSEIAARTSKPNADEIYLEASVELVGLLRWSGRYSREHLTEACTLAKGCFEHCQVRLGRGATCTLDVARYLSIVLKEMGEWDEALAQLHKAMDLELKASRHNPSIEADLLGLTADCLAEKGDLFEALDLRREVLKRREELSGPKGRSATDATFDLASHLNAMGRYDEAEGLLKPVLRRYERDFGFHGEWTTKCAEQLALALQGQGKIEDVTWSAVMAHLTKK